MHHPSPYIQYMYSYPHKMAYRNFMEPLDILPLITQQEGKEASLYFHIPFCHRKCGYCNLFSKAGCSREMVNSYLQALRRQSQQLYQATQSLRFTSFAIGGGTPLLLDSTQFEQLLDCARLFGVNPQHTFTSIETSPDQTHPETLHLLRQQGVSRISIGIQSFHPGELTQLQRHISVKDTYQALEVISQANFPQFNIDLIYGMEGQTGKNLLHSISEALRFNPTELFVYPLYVRPGTGLKKKADDSTCMRLYETARNELTRQGFRQTSMRRFVRSQTPDLEYSCGDETMISCGCGGRSYLGNVHTATPYVVSPKAITKTIQNYIETSDYTKITHGIILNKEEQRRRFICKNLLYYRGLNLQEYENRFGPSTELLQLPILTGEGYAVIRDNYLQLTEKGMAWSDYIGQLFISPAVRTRMNEYDEQQYDNGL